jgi:glycerol-3-phosphate dehydrogenase (NAD(P)+)
VSERAAVVGAGSWGTALANLLAGKGIPTRIWSYEVEVAEQIEREHRNRVYLDGFELAPSLEATTDLAGALRGATLVVSVSPSHVVRQVMTRAAPHLEPGALVVSASKGIENETLLTMDGVLGEVLPAAAARTACFLSGPSFAREVALGYPTAVTVACADEPSALRAQEAFQTPVFRVYTSRDVPGVELGGAVKNVIAIAAGAVEGMGFGHNTQAALITRGLAELMRLGAALGAEPSTLAGLSGIGDLILTCTGALSRNRSVGVELGRGRPLEDILAGMVMVAEGVKTARSTRDLARREGVEMPIVEAVYAMLHEGLDPRSAVEQLMLRAPRPERWG